MTRVGVVMVAYGHEPYLPEAVRSALASAGVAAEVVLVDNGAEKAAVDAVRHLPGVTVLDAGANLGFAGGCNLAVRATDAEVIALFNCDAVLHPDALERLVKVLDDPSVGIATASVRLAGHPELVNSAGNPVHYLGLTWAGGHGEPAARHETPGPVGSASGACCAMTHDWWRRLGGFDEAYFAYHEDVELSIRTWQQGRSVVYVPDAVALHHYEFSRNAGKLQLLERNRLMTVLTTYSGRTLLLLAPALLAQEAGLLAVSATQGWWRAKLDGYGWLLRHAGQLRRRHQVVQQERCCTDKQVMAAFTSAFTPGNIAPVRAAGLLNRASAGYRRLIWPLL